MVSDDQLSASRVLVSGRMQRDERSQRQPHLPSDHVQPYFICEALLESEWSEFEGSPDGARRQRVASCD
jgi:hypothetical protein